MKRIIVQSVKEGNRYLRRINQSGSPISNVKCSKLFTMALEVINQKLAWEGNMEAIQMMDAVSGAIVMEKILKAKASENFFIPVDAINYETAVNIWHMLLQLRMGHVTQEYQNSTEEKIVQIRDVIAEYEKCLEQENKYDICRLFQKAIDILEDDNQDFLMTSEEYGISTFCLESLTALEKKFWELFTKGKYTIVSLQNEEGKELQQCVEKEELPKVFQGAEFFRGYGISNEIQYVIHKIREQKQSFGEVMVLYSSLEYEPFLEATFGSSQIPYRMTSRKLATDNPYVGLMKLILRWADTDFSYQELKPVVRAVGKFHLLHPFYRSIGENIGWGLGRYKAYRKRMLEDPKKAEKRKEYLEFLGQLIGIFEVEDEKQVSYATIYCRLLAATKKIIGNRSEYKVVKNALYQEIRIFEQMGQGDLNDVIRMLQKRLQAVQWTDAEENNAVMIGKLSDKIKIPDRKYIYVLGMSSTHFGSRNVSSPVLSDRELKVYLDGTQGFVSFAEEKEQRLIQSLYHTLAMKKKEAVLHIGYCGYDTIHLRSQAPSVTYLRMLAMAGVTKENIVLAQYSDLLEDSVRFAQQDIWENVETDKTTKETVSEAEGEVAISNPEGKEEEIEDLAGITEGKIPRTVLEGKEGKEEADGATDKELFMSVTSLQTLLGCPLQYYYQKIRHIPQEDYKAPSPDQWLSPAEKGIYVHSVLEEYINQWFVGKEQAKISPTLKENSFDEIEKQVAMQMSMQCPCLSYTAQYLERIEIKEICKQYLTKMHQEFSASDNPWKVEGCEVEYSDLELYYKESGICDTKEEAEIVLSFSGSLDRVDVRMDEQGIKHYRIVDYKSGRKDKLMEKEQEGKLIQHIIYSMAILDKNQQAVVDEVCYHMLFENESENQVFSTAEMKGLSLNKLGDKASKLITDVLIKQEFSSLENMSLNASAADKKLTVTDCSYCTYKDICKEHMGDTL